MAVYDNSGASIRTIGSVAERKSYDENTLHETFRNEFLNEYDAPVNHVLIEEEEDQFLAHIANRNTYSYETVKFGYGDNHINEAVRNYDMQGASTKPTTKTEADFSGYDFFIATPVPEISTANKMVDTIAAFAKATGYSPIVLKGDKATIANYQAAFTAGLKGFVSVGHGSPYGIMLYDGVLSNSWFDGLKGNALTPQVITLNSCQVFNDPFKSAILSHGARTFIGGITNLRIGPSELVTTGFWDTELYRPNESMGHTLMYENQLQPTAGEFGIGGDQGPFA